MKEPWAWKKKMNKFLSFSLALHYLCTQNRVDVESILS